MNCWWCDWHDRLAWMWAVTDHFEHVGDLWHVIAAEVLQKWNTTQEVDVVVDTLHARLLHDVLEHSSVQHPHFGSSYRCYHHQWKNSIGYYSGRLNNALVDGFVQLVQVVNVHWPLKLVFQFTSLHRFNFNG